MYSLRTKQFPIVYRHLGPGQSPKRSVPRQYDEWNAIHVDARPLREFLEVFCLSRHEN